jgi:hypothetical protein
VEQRTYPTLIHKPLSFSFIVPKHLFCGNRLFLQIATLQNVQTDLCEKENGAVKPCHWGIPYRNDWMLRQADFVVTYITHSWGGAYQYAEKVGRQKKVVINLKNFLTLT